MTEITEYNVSPFYPPVSTRRHLIDPTAFGLAMVGGPIITGIAGAPLLLIPSFATLFGGPIYLLAGVPVMLFHLRRHRPKPAGWALLALATFLALFTSVTLIAWAKNGNLNGISAILIFGSVFAPIWGSVSGAIYHRLERDFFKQTL